MARSSWNGYGSIPINTIFSGMNIHLPAILMFTRGTRFWHTAKSLDIFGNHKSSPFHPGQPYGTNWNQSEARLQLPAGEEVLSRCIGFRCREKDRQSGLVEHNRSIQIMSVFHFRYPLVMTNSLPQYRWPIEIDGLPNLKMVDLSMATLNNQIVSQVSESNSAMGFKSLLVPSTIFITFAGEFSNIFQLCSCGWYCPYIGTPPGFSAFRYLMYVYIYIHICVYIHNRYI